MTAESKKLLDMTLNAVDDMYNGCREEAMEKFIDSGLLRRELTGSKNFQKAWNANTQCPKLIPGGIKEHTAALLAYTNGDAYFVEGFNKKVKTLGVNLNTYEDHFNFKSLHFLLMDAIRLLNPKTCSTMYFFSDDQYTAPKGSKVRFGGFTKANSRYSEEKDMEDLVVGVFFNITSCFFANLGDNICSEDKNVVLLSPAEVFTVEAVKERTEGFDTYTEIVLKHSDMNSLHNCYIFSR